MPYGRIKSMGTTANHITTFVLWVLQTALQQSMFEESDYCDRFSDVLLISTAAQVRIEVLNSRINQESYECKL
jgi:uncharacterized protein YbaP (TraB family)